MRYKKVYTYLCLLLLQQNSMIDVIEECTIMLQTPNNPSLCLPLVTCLPFYDIFYMASYKHPALWEKRNQISIVQWTG